MKEANLPVELGNFSILDQHDLGFYQESYFNQLRSALDCMIRQHLMVGVASLKVRLSDRVDPNHTYRAMRSFLAVMETPMCRLYSDGCNSWFRTEDRPMASYQLVLIFAGSENCGYASIIRECRIEWARLMGVTVAGVSVNQFRTDDILVERLRDVAINRTDLQGYEQACKWALGTLALVAKNMPAINMIPYVHMHGRGNWI